MKLNLLTVCFFIFSLGTLQAQIAVSFGNPTAQLVGQKGLIASDGSVVATGKLYLNNSSANGDRPYMAMFDSNYVMKWAFYLDETSYTAGQVIETPGHDFVACWSTGVNSILLKVDALGNILWYRNFSNIHSIEGLAATEFEEIYASGNFLQEAVVMKLGGGGNIIWSKSFNAQSNYHFGRGVEIANDGNIVVLGAASFVNSSTHNRISLMKLTPGGQMVWSHIYNCSTNSILATNFDQSPANGSFLIAGYSGHPSNTTAMNCLSILVDSSGNYINNTELSYQYWDQYYAVTALPGGEFVLSGLCKPQSVCGGNAIFVKVDANNDTILTKTYGEVAGQGALFTDIKYSAGEVCAFGSGSMFKYWNGGAELECLKMDNLLNAGCHEYAQVYNQNSLPVNQTGTLTESSFTPSYSVNYNKINHQISAGNVCSQTPLQAANYPSANKRFQIYPNPSTQRIYIRSFEARMQSVELRDLQGKVLQRYDQIQSPVLDLDVSQFIPSVYVLHIVDADGNSYLEKMVVE